MSSPPAKPIPDIKNIKKEIEKFLKILHI